MDEFKSVDDVIRASRPDVPVTCFRPAALAAAATWFLDNISGHALYAVKANPAPYVIEGLFAAGIRHFDAASIPEIQLVRQHAPGAHVAFMHPVKSRQAIEQAYFDHGVRDFSFDTVDELNKIVAMTGQSKDLNLLLRLAVPQATSGLFMSGKFGCPPEKTIELLKAARKIAKRLGVCFHVGSQMMDPGAYTAAIGRVGDMLRANPRLKIDIIDIGGGFPSIYPGMNPPPLSTYKDAIEAGLAQLPNPGSYEIWSEPGRALVAESASVVTRVELRKDDALYLNDGTFGSLFDASLTVGFDFPMRVIRANGKKTGAGLKPFRFYGPTCTSEDYMPGPFLLPGDIKEGDYIEIGQLGAYGNTMRTNFNGFYHHEIIAVDAPPLMTLYGPEKAKQRRKAAAGLCVA